MSKIKVVSAGKKAERIEDIPASVLIITKEEIEKYGYQDLKEIIENIPGFYITDDRSGQDASINVRGFWSPEASHVYITVNGVSQMFDSYDHYPLSEMAIPVESIDRIEVVRGPMSVIYGSGAFFGSINIVTDDNITHKNCGQVSALYGFNNHERVTFITRVKQGDLHFNVNASIENQQWESLAYNDLMTTPGGIGLQDKKTGTKPIESKSKYFNVSGKFRSFYSHFSFAEVERGVLAFYAPIPDYKISKEINNLRFALGFKHEFNKKFIIDSKLEYGNNTSSVSDWILWWRQSVYGYILESMKYNQLELNTFYKPTDKLDITVGAVYRSNFKNLTNQDNVYVPNAVNSRYRLKPGDKIIRYAVFTEVDMQLTNNLRITGGVRLEKQSEYNIFKSYRLDMDTLEVHNESTVPESNLNFIPRLAVIYSINKNNIFKIMYGKAIKQPAIMTNLAILNYNTILNENKPFLEEEIIETLELNYISSISSKYFINASVFRNEMRNLVQHSVALIPNTNAYLAYADNAGEYITYGIEFSTITNPIENLNVTLSATYQETKDQNRTDLDVSFSPNLLGYFKVLYDFRFRKTDDNKSILTVGMTGNYVDRMLSYWDTRLEDAADPGSNEIGRIGEETQAYFVLNGNARLNNLLLSGLWIDLKIYNLLNTKIYSPTYTYNAWADKGMLGRARHIMISIGYKF